jgi:hypothetical protein
MTVLFRSGGGLSFRVFVEVGVKWGRGADTLDLIMLVIMYGLTGESCFLLSVS